MPEGLVSIGDSAFYNCSGFTGNLKLPEGLTAIGNSVFRECEGFDGSLDLPEGLESIGNYAFGGCSGFTGSLKLPKSLSSIGDRAFISCSGFTGSLEIPDSLTNIDDFAFDGCFNLTGSLDLPEGLKSIGNTAFGSCVGFTSIVIPSSITSIGEWAFLGCDSVTGISIPASVTSIGERAFSCVALSNVYYGGNAQQWASIAVGELNDMLMDAHIYYNTYYAKGDSMPALTDNAVPVPVLAPSADAAVSCNLGRHEYSDYGRTVQSYLYDNGNGLTRVEYRGGTVVVENYDPFFQYQAGYTLEPELPLWGGFYAGEKYNFLILGQENYGEDESREVIRVVKYDKNWNRLSHASLYGADTVEPFAFGSLRCDEYDGTLYVRTCHKMYDHGDGLNHQDNMTFCVREADMKILGNSEVSAGYVSHSFNQFLMVDAEENIVTLDHGDALPRSAILRRFPKKPGNGTLYYDTGNSDELDLKVFSGETGDNTTGASLGGLAETASGYVVAYNYNEQLQDQSREIYISYIPKDNISEEGMRTWSSVTGGTPVVVSTGAEGGYVFWNNYDSGNPVVQYVGYDSQGNISQVQTDEGLKLSDCQPIVYQGRMVWYVTEYSVPQFYSLPVQGAAAGPEGLAQGPDGGWYYYRNGVVDTAYTGLVPNDAGWWYVENESINFGYTGLVYDSAVGWWYVENGSINFGYTGLVCDPNVGWWYVREGTVAFDYTGLVSNDAGWWYVENGSINFGYTGLVCDPVLGWWYVENGSINFGYTGLVCDPVLGWWYVENGSINFGYTGLVCDPVLGWWYVENGSINFGYTGLVCDPVMGWWYVENGSINFGYTGLVEDSVMGWWYVENGSINFGYTGLVEDSVMGWWYVEGGSIRFDYTGFASNESGTWYLMNGSIAFDYTGTVEYDGAVWQVVGGKLV